MPVAGHHLQDEQPQSTFKGRHLKGKEYGESDDGEGEPLG